MFYRMVLGTWALVFIFERYSRKTGFRDSRVERSASSYDASSKQARVNGGGNYDLLDYGSYFRVPMIGASTNRPTLVIYTVIIINIVIQYSAGQER